MKFTQKQKDFLSHAKWFFNTDRNRASGRTTAAAWAAVKLATEGKTVYMYDPSLVFSHGTYFHVHKHFYDVVRSIAAEDFPNHEFEFNMAQHTLRCVGQR